MTIRATTAIAPSYAVGLPPNAGSEWHPHQSSAWVGTPNDEALPLLLTLSSGVTGFTTIHAGSARQALTRLRFICQLADASGGLPLAALNTLVSESIDVVVHCARTPEGPRVTEVAMVEDLQGSPEATQSMVPSRRGAAAGL